MMKNEDSIVESEINDLKELLQNYEDMDPAYMGEEMQKLRHFTMYTHLRMEESLGSLIVRNQLRPYYEPIPRTEPPREYTQAFSAGTTIAIEVDFARKVNMAQDLGEIDKDVASLMYGVNEQRKWFAHPIKYQNKLQELKNDRNGYKVALEKLVEAHKEMNGVFVKFVSPKKPEGIK